MGNNGSRNNKFTKEAPSAAEADDYVSFRTNQEDNGGDETPDWTNLNQSKLFSKSDKSQSKKSIKTQKKVVNQAPLADEANVGFPTIEEEKDGDEQAPDWSNLNKSKLFSKPYKSPSTKSIKTQKKVVNQAPLSNEANDYVGVPTIEEEKDVDELTLIYSNLSQTSFSSLKDSNPKQPIKTQNIVNNIVPTSQEDIRTMVEKFDKSVGRILSPAEKAQLREKILSTQRKRSSLNVLRVSGDASISNSFNWSIKEASKNSPSALPAMHYVSPDLYQTNERQHLVVQTKTSNIGSETAQTETSNIGSETPISIQEFVKPENLFENFIESMENSTKTKKSSENSIKGINISTDPHEQQRRTSGIRKPSDPLEKFKKPNQYSVEINSVNIPIDPREQQRGTSQIRKPSDPLDKFKKPNQTSIQETNLIENPIDPCEQQRRTSQVRKPSDPLGKFKKPNQNSIQAINHNEKRIESREQQRRTSQARKPSDPLGKFKKPNQNSTQETNLIENPIDPCEQQRRTSQVRKPSDPLDKFRKRNQNSIQKSNVIKNPIDLREQQRRTSQARKPSDPLDKFRKPNQNSIQESNVIKNPIDPHEQQRRTSQVRKPSDPLDKFRKPNQNSIQETNLIENPIDPRQQQRRTSQVRKPSEPLHKFIKPSENLIQKIKPSEKSIVHHEKQSIASKARKPIDPDKNPRLSRFVPPVYISCTSGYPKSRGTTPADRLKNLDIVEELTYYPQNNCCGTEAYDFFNICNDCGYMEVANDGDVSRPVTYSKKQRFSFKSSNEEKEDDRDGPPFNWPFNNTTSTYRTSSFDELPVGKNPHLVYKANVIEQSIKNSFDESEKDLKAPEIKLKDQSTSMSTTDFTNQSATMDDSGLGENYCEDENSSLQFPSHTSMLEVCSRQSKQSFHPLKEVERFESSTLCTCIDFDSECYNQNHSTSTFTKTSKNFNEEECLCDDTGSETDCSSVMYQPFNVQTSPQCLNPNVVGGSIASCLARNPTTLLTAKTRISQKSFHFVYGSTVADSVNLARSCQTAVTKSMPVCKTETITITAKNKHQLGISKKRHTHSAKKTEIFRKSRIPTKCHGFPEVNAKHPVRSCDPAIKKPISVPARCKSYTRTRSRSKKIKKHVGTGLQKAKNALNTSFPKFTKTPLEPKIPHQRNQSIQVDFPELECTDTEDSSLNHMQPLQSPNILCPDSLPDEFEINRSIAGNKVEILKIKQQLSIGGALYTKANSMTKQTFPLPGIPALSKIHFNDSIPAMNRSHSILVDIPDSIKPICHNESKIPSYMAKELLLPQKNKQQITVAHMMINESKHEESLRRYLPSSSLKLSKRFSNTAVEKPTYNPSKLEIIPEENEDMEEEFVQTQAQVYREVKVENSETVKRNDGVMKSLSKSPKLHSLAYSHMKSNEFDSDSSEPWVVRNEFANSLSELRPSSKSKLISTESFPSKSMTALLLGAKPDSNTGPTTMQKKSTQKSHNSKNKVVSSTFGKAGNNSNLSVINSIPVSAISEPQNKDLDNLSVGTGGSGSLASDVDEEIQLQELIPLVPKGVKMEYNARKAEIFHKPDIGLESKSKNHPPDKTTKKAKFFSVRKDEDSSEALKADPENDIELKLIQSVNTITTEHFYDPDTGETKVVKTRKLKIGEMTHRPTGPISPDYLKPLGLELHRNQSIHIEPPPPDLKDKSNSDPKTGESRLPNISNVSKYSFNANATSKADLDNLEILFHQNEEDTPAELKPNEPLVKKEENVKVLSPGNITNKPIIANMVQIEDAQISPDNADSLLRKTDLQTNGRSEKRRQSENDKNKIGSFNGSLELQSSPASLNTNQGNVENVRTSGIHANNPASQGLVETKGTPGPVAIISKNPGNNKIKNAVLCDSKDEKPQEMEMQKPRSLSSGSNAPKSHSPKPLHLGKTEINGPKQIGGKEPMMNDGTIRKNSGLTSSGKEKEQPKLSLGTPQQCVETHEVKPEQGLSKSNKTKADENKRQSDCTQVIQVKPSKLRELIPLSTDNKTNLGRIDCEEIRRKYCEPKKPQLTEIARQHERELCKPREQQQNMFVDPLMKPYIVPTSVGTQIRTCTPKTQISPQAQLYETEKESRIDPSSAQYRAEIKQICETKEHNSSTDPNSVIQELKPLVNEMTTTASLPNTSITIGTQAKVGKTKHHTHQHHHHENLDPDESCRPKEQIFVDPLMKLSIPKDQLSVKQKPHNMKSKGKHKDKSPRVKEVPDKSLQAPARKCIPVSPVQEENQPSTSTPISVPNNIERKKDSIQTKDAEQTSTHIADECYKLAEEMLMMKIRKRIEEMKTIEISKCEDKTPESCCNDAKGELEQSKAEKAEKRDSSIPFEIPDSEDEALDTCTDPKLDQEQSIVEKEENEDCSDMISLETCETEISPLSCSELSQTEELQGFEQKLGQEQSTVETLTYEVLTPKLSCNNVNLIVSIGQHQQGHSHWTVDHGKMEVGCSKNILRTPTCEVEMPELCCNDVNQYQSEKPHCFKPKVKQCSEEQVTMKTCCRQSALQGKSCPCTSIPEKYSTKKAKVSGSPVPYRDHFNTDFSNIPEISQVDSDTSVILNLREENTEEQTFSIEGGKFMPLNDTIFNIATTTKIPFHRTSKGIEYEEPVTNTVVTKSGPSFHGIAAKPQPEQEQKKKNSNIFSNIFSGKGTKSSASASSKDKIKSKPLQSKSSINSNTHASTGNDPPKLSVENNEAGHENGPQKLSIESTASSTGAENNESDADIFESYVNDINYTKVNWS